MSTFKSVENLQPDEELSNQRISELIHQFTINFNERYPSPGPALLIGSLDAALTESLYKGRDVRILLSLNNDIYEIIPLNFLESTIDSFSISRCKCAYLFLLCTGFMC